VTLTNSILSFDVPSGANCFNGGGGKISSRGHNLASDASCSLVPALGDLFSFDPLLGPLGMNGGATLTQVPQPGSKAIDAGDPAFCPPTDQRGVARPLDGDGDSTAVCDIGAVEVGVKPALSTITPNSATAGGPAITLTLFGSGFLPGATALWNGADRPTTYVNATTLTALIAASDLAAGGTVPVAVRYGATPAETSNSLPFTITSPPGTPEPLKLVFVGAAATSYQGNW
jgi:hypothetical protein